jgi:hypothetical protein
MDYERLRAPPEMLSQMDDDAVEEEVKQDRRSAAAAAASDDVYIAATQSDEEAAAESEIDSDVMDDEQFERWTKASGLTARTARRHTPSAHSPALTARSSDRRSNSSAGSSPIPPEEVPALDGIMSRGSDSDRDDASPLQLLVESTTSPFQPQQSAAADELPRRLPLQLPELQAAQSQLPAFLCLASPLL